MFYLFLLLVMCEHVQWDLLHVLCCFFFFFTIAFFFLLLFFFPPHFHRLILIFFFPCCWFVVEIDWWSCNCSAQIFLSDRFCCMYVCLFFLTFYFSCIFMLMYGRQLKRKGKACLRVGGWLGIFGIHYSCIFIY